MTHAVIARETAEAMSAGESSRGWYFYGITRPGPLEPVLTEADGPDEDGPLQLLAGGGLAALVRPVALTGYDRAVLEQRLSRAPELEAMVSSHHRVIEAVHARQAILPARLGTIYARPDDIVASLRAGHDALARQLERLDGCNEWAIHLFADRAAVREHVMTVDAELRALREALAGASRGRAFFLERQRRDRLESATREALVSLAQQAFDRLRRDVVDGEIGAAGDRDAEGEVEILRASFLVRREDTERFLADVRSSATIGEGVRCEWSGPWPPYSFASVHSEAAP